MEAQDNLPQVPHSVYEIVTSRISAELEKGELPCRKPTIDYSQILTVEELAARMKVGKSWIYEKTRSRSGDPLPVLRIGKYIRFYWPDVSDWIECHRHG